MPVSEQDVRAPDDPTLLDVEHVAIAIAKTHLGWCHMGIIVRVDSGDHVFDLLHLRFHYDFVREQLPTLYHWVEPRVPPERAIQVAAFCDEVSSRYPDGALPYAFRYKGGGFDRASGELLSTTGRGLSCATFVLALFATVGVDLLDLETWGPRAEDAAWQASIVELGRTHRAHAKDHWDYLEQSESGCTRYRPEEVAIGATAVPLPARFDDVAEAAGRLAARLPVVL